MAAWLATCTTAALTIVMVVMLVRLEVRSLQSRRRLETMAKEMRSDTARRTIQTKAARTRARTVPPGAAPAKPMSMRDTAQA